MVTRSDLPFALTFLQHDTNIPVEVFSTDPSFPFEQVPQIVENVQLEVLFQSEDPNAQFYMDGLEVLSEQIGLELDKHRIPYLTPQDEPWLLFKNTQTEEYYPLIPGFYRIKVVAGGTAYHSMIRVIPKQLTVEQWEIMRDELEAELRGLAQDLIRKNLGYGDPLLQFLPPEHLFRFLVIKKHFSAVMAALSDLRTKVNYRIRKNYRMIPAERATAVDQETIRHRLTHPEQMELKSPVREVDYNLPENRWVKRIVQMLGRYLNEIVEALDAYVRRIDLELEEFQNRYPNRELTAHLRERQRTKKDLSTYSEVAKRMRYGVQVIQTAEWYDNVAPHAPTYVSPVLLQDPRYRALYLLYRELKAENLEINLDTSYAYQWKRTDLLYEMWGFLKICSYLSHSLGYQPISGWLYDLNNTGGSIFIPTLPPETRIVLESEDVRLHLIYNAVIPNREDADPQRDPIYLLTSFHDRPDGRIDVYKAGVYMGSLILEFKYRPRYGRYPFWDVSSRSTAKRPTATNQLISYYRDSASNLLGVHTDSHWRGRTRPVYETWALYPRRTGDDSPQVNEFFQDYFVRLLVLTPGQENAHVIDQLRKALDEILNPAGEMANL
jgi:hypothetical protein